MRPSSANLTRAAAAAVTSETFFSYLLEEFQHFLQVARNNHVTEPQKPSALPQWGSVEKKVEFVKALGPDVSACLFESNPRKLALASQQFVAFYDGLAKARTITIRCDAVGNEFTPRIEHDMDSRHQMAWRVLAGAMPDETLGRLRQRLAAPEGAFGRKRLSPVQKELFALGQSGEEFSVVDVLRVIAANEVVAQRATSRHEPRTKYEPVIFFVHVEGAEAYLDALTAAHGSKYGHKCFREFLISLYDAKDTMMMEHALVLPMLSGLTSTRVLTETNRIPAAQRCSPAFPTLLQHAAAQLVPVSPSAVEAVVVEASHLPQAVTPTVPSFDRTDIDQQISIAQEWFNSRQQQYSTEAENPGLKRMRCETHPVSTSLAFEGTLPLVAHTPRACHKRGRTDAEVVSPNGVTSWSPTRGGPVIPVQQSRDLLDLLFAMK